MLFELSSTNAIRKNLSAPNKVSLSMDSFFERFALSDERNYRISRHFFFWFTCWVFMGFIYGFPYFSEDKGSFFALAYFEAILYLPQHMILSYGIIYFILPKFIFKGQYWSGIAAVLILILLVSLLSPVIANFVIVPIRRAWGFPVRPGNILYVSLLAGIRGSMTVAGFAVAIRLVKLWYLNKVDKERLEKTTLRAELGSSEVSFIRILCLTRLTAFIRWRSKSQSIHRRRY